MTSEPMRIQRALARAGIASRRAAEELVVAGRVTVNGSVARTGQIVHPTTDEIRVDGKRVEAPRGATWRVLNKPIATLTSRPDGTGRRTVFDLVPDAPGLTYVGRLDYMTEGVLLLTTDGDAAHALTHPSRQVERRYVATVRGDAPAAARQAAAGVELEDGVVHPRALETRNIRRGVWELGLTIREGKNHEVRRICEALGLEVERLVRTRFGPVELGDLPAGAVRALTVKERAGIDVIVKQPQRGTGKRGERPRS
ncbi:MAG TPA: pseudouridine synthase [Gemmatimonadaceae bacterium]|nr:pseudouridine synthase [Gemmatimonadaceae bacterium]